tara:strand:- start:64 stop:519 length:456 start_codon:yes stop_codon:yes gene_type:complete
MEYKEILLKTAVCAIASDGIIDERETKALYSIEKKSTYFSSNDLEKTLDLYLDKCISDIDVFIDSTLDNISSENLNAIQELELLEISFRIIHADGIVVDKEEKFISKLRSVLEIDDLIIAERFGAIEYLGITDATGIFSDEENNDLTKLEE